MATLLLALLTLATPRGQNATLNQALQAYDDLDYDSAARLLDQAVAVPDLTPGDQKLAGFYGGIVYFDLNQPEKARAAFTRALELDPTLALGPDASPKLQDFFDGVKRELASSAKPKPDVPPAQSPPSLTPSKEPAAAEQVAEPGEKPLYEKPLFWVGVGATVVVVAAGVFIATRSSGPSCASKSGAGCIDIQVQQQGLAQW